ncbi:MAG: hypothetical protein IJ786_00765 [Bacteroidaceae bacterium]|nr:hypothetical protein [Bacteroidaceae bacterium]
MNFEDELLQDAQEDAFIVSHIQTSLPAEVAARFEEEDLYYILDVCNEYFSESGILESEADDDGFVEIDLTAAAQYVADKARQERDSAYAIEDLELIIEAQLNYGDQ